MIIYEMTDKEWKEEIIVNAISLSQTIFEGKIINNFY